MVANVLCTGPEFVLKWAGNRGIPSAMAWRIAYVAHLESASQSLKTHRPQGRCHALSEKI